MDKNCLNKPIIHTFEGDISQINASKDQIKKIENLSDELIELCEILLEAAN